MGLIAGTLRAILDLYIIAVCVHAAMSWFPSWRHGRAMAVLDRLVEPALKPIRSLIEPLQRGAGVDLSPVVLVLILVVIERIL